MTQPAQPVVDVLLVDDEQRNLDALELILSDQGYRLHRADNADLALHTLLAHDIAAIVLDIKMPGVSGFELAHMIKNTKRFREIPIVFLTAYMVDDQDIIAGYGAGGVDYLTKPINPQILRQKISVFAELFRKTRALTELNEKLEDRVKERTAELEKSEGALRIAAGQKDDFLAVLAHELRNPLAPLRTGLDILLRQPASTPAIGRTLAAMNRQLDHMVRLIDDLLDISRISRGVLELKKERADLGATIEAAVESTRPFFGRRSQVLTMDLAPAIVADVDPTRVSQILSNLLHNATKFTPNGGHVTVELRRAATDAVVRVIDSGVGIAPSQMDRVFDMFARIQRPGVTAESGLGIGLALARRLAEMHGGTLTAQSPGEGQGTAFTLTLPATADLLVTRATNGVATHKAGALRVLVIEDNEDVAETMSAWLEDLGHQVSVAHSGQQGIELVGAQRPQVVLCDLGLPELDGLEVCRRIRGLAIAAQPVMIALTGWGREGDRERTKEAGFDHHLVKPVALDKLQAVLDSIA